MPERYKRGLRFERAFVDAHWGVEGFVAGPWIQFVSQVDGLPHAELCQPDFLYIDPWRGRVVIGEIKYAHTPKAWEQLKLLYEPVVRRLLGPDFDYALVEVVRWYDPDTVFPCAVTLQENPFETLPGKFGVHIWNPKRFSVR